MQTHGYARLAWALMPGKGVLASVQEAAGPFGTKQPDTGIWAGVGLGSTFPYFHALQHGVISAVTSVLEHGISSGIISFAQT